MPKPGNTLIRKAEVRRLILNFAKQRQHEFTRVSASVYEELERQVWVWCADLVKVQPSKGKTIV